MDRDRLIELLIDDRLEKLGIAQHSRRFLQVVEREFKDLNGLSDEELTEELSRRGIVEDLDSPDEPVDGAGEDAEDDEEEVSSMLRDLHPRDDDWVPIPG